MKAGETLGPYRILDKLGEGGMGEVYRATDTNLKRAVAIKVLPESVAADAERLARFQREAEVLAALNHPNIAAIYGLERAGPTTALVMELVEGPTLAERIERSRGLPLDEALAIARQIAEALEAAHEQGIVHRDLKPANVKVRPDGTVKVLDFGLAKAMDAAGASFASASMAPTITTPAMTQAGMVLGTAAYMAPEQAKGRGADRRADVWAFGVVLYEMLTGERLFGGDTVPETLASVIKDPLPLDRLPADTPRAIRTLVSRCLDRDLRRRMQSIGDARIVIEDTIAGVTPEDVGTLKPAQVPVAPNRTPWAVAAILLVALAALAWAWYPRPSASGAGLVHFTIAPPDDTVLTGSTQNATQQAISPDGRNVVFLADEAGAKRGLWVRPLGSVTAQKLDRTEDATFPFWSPDSQFIAFFQDGKLRRIPVSGGSPITICDAPSGEGGTWNRDGTIIFAPTDVGSLQHVAARGGAPAPVTELGDGELSHAWPWFLPDGQRFLYLVRGSTPEKTGLYVQRVGSTERTFLMTTQGRGAIVAAADTRVLLFMRDNTVFAQRIDLDSLRLEGEPVPIAEEVRTGATNGRNSFSVSDTGVMVYRSGGTANERVTWYTRDGKAAATALEPSAFTSLELSPDDRKVAVAKFDPDVGNLDLWLLDLESRVFSRLTTGSGQEDPPVWSPDSKRVAFSSGGNGIEITETVVGSGTQTTILADGKTNYLDDWSRDGKILLFHNNGGKSVFVLPLEGDRKPQLVLDVPFETEQFRISPDGRWVAYRSSESGQSEVYVAAFPAFTDRRQISTGGAMMPLWRRDGRELFYLTQDRRFVSRPIQTGATLDIGPATVLFQTAMALNGNSYYYAVTSDGQRFLVREPASDVAVEPLHVILNWPSLLGQ